MIMSKRGTAILHLKNLPIVFIKKKDFFKLYNFAFHYQIIFILMFFFKIQLNLFVKQERKVSFILIILVLRLKFL